MDVSGADTAEPERSGGAPADQLARLLERADNGAAAARRLDAVRFALMHYCGLQSCRHTKGPPRRMNRRTFRHSFLLPDGSVRVLWELEHDTGPDALTHRSVFTEQEGLTLAEWEVDTAFGGSTGPQEMPYDARTGAPRLDRATEDVDALLAPGPENALRRAYTEGDSAEHARRLLRRAANTGAGAPGSDVGIRLRAAIAHDISIVTRGTALVAGRHVSWSLYEHAFLLLDGSEVSLWEIDHTRTPSGDPVCEVYASQDAAMDTAIRRIEAG
ncbi:DUF6227 family protein [Actinacidiphila paucisporea]|uniref:Uncharacterized protein n=1 Tax=Actinacidiphila paucisporea TaxID=310782 RepID=A0A1M7AP76_9ACTN|nr:DUF6227 family protein [Actinacidiphila paucisporea]SHL44475.1 hypothetical protein SAMN05216499_104154 [Actinacidiphila paucisporea]